MSPDEQLEAIFRDVGRRYGYDQVEARFLPFKEFKSTWYRSGRRAIFQVSDYLMTADADVLGDFGGALFGRIARRGRGELYSERMREWLQSRAFVERNQPIYLNRSRNLSFSAAGRSYDLKESYQRLLNDGLVGDCGDAFLTWTVRGNRMRVGYCSVLMKVVAISSALDSDKMPEFVQEYVLYHELLHLESGLRSDGRHHDADFKRRERAYPRWREAEGWLRRIANQRP